MCVYIHIYIYTYLYRHIYIYNTHTFHRTTQRHIMRGVVKRQRLRDKYINKGRKKSCPPMLIDSPPKKTLSFIFLYSYIHFQNYMPMSANYQFITPSGQNPNLFLYSEKVGLNFKNVSLCHLAYYGFSEEECCRTLIPDSDVLSSDSSSTNTLLQGPVPSLHLAFPALGSCNAVLQQ